jgi:AcrR family transcriptional regulator
MRSRLLSEVVRATVGPTFTMSEVVARTGIAPSTIRYYISTGLVPPGYRVAANRHLYDERHVESLRLVHLLKERRKLRLSAIRKILPELLELPADGAFRPEMWEQLVEARARSSAKTSPAARLLEAGVDAFTRRGYAEVRVDDVCQAAKIAKGSFYRHFASKEELFFASAREVADVAGKRFLASEARKSLLTPDEALAILADALEPNLALMLDLMALAVQRRPGHGRVLREIFTYLYRTVRSRLVPVAAPSGAAGVPGVPGTGGAEEILERALVAGIRRVVVSPLLDRELFPGESAL